jgi:DNA primase
MIGAATGAGIRMARNLIPDELISQIRERVDIADVIGQHVSLSRAGQNLKGLCPFHQEKTASFSVSPSRQIFHCFGCGSSGDVFTFLTKITGASFPDTVRELGRRAGIEVPETAFPSSSGRVAESVQLERINESAAQWYRQNLSDAAAGKEARVYLAERGIHAETIERFGFGFAPNEGLVRTLSQQGYSLDDLSLAGLVGLSDHAARPGMAKRAYDRFRRRVMFPIIDLRTRIIGFGGRALGADSPKYLNSPETPLFKKGQTLFALNLAREAAVQSKTCIIVEGYFDAVALHQTGIRNAVATLGTALTPDHVQILRRFATNIVLLFDPDAAGVRAALRSLDLFVNSGMTVTVVSLPEGEDPDTFVRRRGPEAFVRLQEQAPALLDFAVEQSMRTAQAGSLEDRIRAVDEILRIIQKGEHPIERDERIRLVADRLGISQQRLIERYRTVLGPRKPGAAAPAAGAAATEKPRNHPEERELIYFLLQGQLSASDTGRLSPELFVVPLYRRAIEIALGHRGSDGRVPARETLDAMLADSECAALAAELSLLQQHCDDVTTHIRTCLDKLERKRREAELQSLIVQLKAAEYEKRDDDARRLNVRINELRMRKAGVPMPAATPQ